MFFAASPQLCHASRDNIFKLDSRFAPLFVIPAFGGNDKQERRE
ncbi:hypothetical protein [Candidatus Spongiihabitans sp.]